VLSTREAPSLRDHLVRLGVTHVSAGSHTEPGGYTGAGKEDLHLTRAGRRIESEGEHATEQFSIADERSPGEVCARLRQLGYEPVWKDWDAAILNAAATP
ncbi:MAG: 2-iminoacetate synthase ThiH, partial [Verrucomicrobiae bacterium]|nr:2-iminoacetate synthase ThiH [Verrucomicrobiae bacterium]